jgi:hypothetical protein
MIRDTEAREIERLYAVYAKTVGYFGEALKTIPDHPLTFFPIKPYQRSIRRYIQETISYFFS